MYDIAILIPHYNNLEGLIKSIESIHSKRDLVIVIIDDGSSQEIRPEMLDDSGLKIVLIYNEFNQGIEDSLNKGLLFIENSLNVKYIARLDCGDIMINNRLDKQADFLDKYNGNYGLVGSWVEFFNEKGTLFTLKLPSNHKSIARSMMIGVPLIHPAVMFRTNLLDHIGLYTKEFPAAEDYAFFMKAIHYTRVANLPEVLTLVENNETGISIAKRNAQLISRLKILWKYRKPTIYFVFGICKILLLMLVPYKYVLFIKQVVYK